METKEQKPWYHGVKWYWRDVQNMRTLAPGVLVLGDGIGCGGPWGDTIDQRNAELIAAAPETATQRDELLSVQKQLVEALEPFAAIADRADDCHGDGDPFGTNWSDCDRARTAMLAAKASS